MVAVAFVIPYPIVALPTNVGAPGAKLYFYAPGTTTLVPVYVSSALTTQLSNPVLCDGAGRAPNIYLDGANTYKLVIKSKTGATLYTQDPYTPGTVSGLIMASGVTVVTPQSFGAVGNGVTDDGPAIQSAIDAVAATGGILTFPPAIYAHSGLVFKNKVQYVGSGRDSAVTKGTVLLYTGTGDGVQVNNPINSSTAANITVEGIAFRNQTRTAGKGSFADTGSTDIKFRNCGFYGSDRGLIFDQTELADCVDCEFVPTATSATCGVWIVNGADRTLGATAGYSNRISITRSQINGSATAYGIIDDGGNAHSFVDNNYNGCLNHIRAAGVTGLKISAGEFESAASAPLKFDSTSLAANSVGSCSSVYVGDGAEIIPATGQYCINAASLGNITLDTVFFGNTSAVKFAGTVNTNLICALNCTNGGGGATFDGLATNHFEVGSNGTSNAIRTNMPLQSTAAIGYATGGGGAVTQATSKATGVTLDKPNGAITMHNAALAASTIVSFTLTNSFIAADDDVRVRVKSGNASVGSYRVASEGNASGSRTIVVENKTAGSLSEAIVLGFEIIKGTVS